MLDAMNFEIETGRSPTTVSSNPAGAPARVTASLPSTSGKVAPAGASDKRACAPTVDDEIDRLRLLRAAAIAGRAFGFAVDQVLEARGRRRQRVRHVAIYLAVVGCDARMRRVARVLGVDLYCLQYGLRRVEDRREDHKFDRLLTRLEREMLR